ncbi:amidohydrolase family protein [Ruminococcus sp. 5_1_39BFAA]|uniref:amidohydrolase family protein n=1 Tax=Ruminococcus sp. 5_1_39BFAA TaxID=457412 RepID=UPI003569628D
MEERELFEEIKKLPVIDTHEHFETYTETFGYTMPQFLYNCSCASVFSGDLDKEDLRMIESRNVSEKEQFQALLRIRSRIRFTSSQKSMDRISQKLGYELREENYELLSRGFQERSESRIRGFAPNIRGYICNSIGHPLYGGMRGLKAFLEGQIRADEKMHRVLNVTPFHCIDGKKQLEDLEYTAGHEIGNLNEWEAACEKIIDGFVKQGIAGFKELYFYFRPMQLERPDKEKAQKEFDALLKGEKAGTGLMDYLMYRIYELISKTGLPVAVHTGGLMDTAVTAKDFYQYIKIMNGFPELKFDLLHLNYPNLPDYLVALKSCPNAYANAAWITTSNEEYCLQFIRLLIDHISVERCSFFGGDRTCAGEAVEVALEQTWQVLAEGLEELIKRGRMGSADALEIAKLWLYENPKKLYEIDVR